MTTALLPARRIAVSPYARRLARERDIALAVLVGSGPAGRIVAADVAAFVPKAAAPALSPSANVGPQASAIATTIALSTMRGLLSGFGDAATAFTMDDVVLRAAGCALDDVAGSNTITGSPVAIETKLSDRRAQFVFADIRKGSLGPLRQRRLAALAAGVDQSMEPAAMSVRVVDAGDIRPVTMPLLAGRSMRLVLIAGPATGECLLSFDSATIDEDVAAEVLSRIKAYLEVPIRLLA